MIQLYQRRRFTSEFTLVTPAVMIMSGHRVTESRRGGARRSGSLIGMPILLCCFLAAMAMAGVANAGQDADAGGVVRDGTQDEPDEPASLSPQTEGPGAEAANRRFGALGDPQELLTEIQDRNAEKVSIASSTSSGSRNTAST